MKELEKPFFGSCDEFLDDEEYFLRQRAKVIAETNYLSAIYGDYEEDSDQ